MRYVIHYYCVDDVIGIVEEVYPITNDESLETIKRVLLAQKETVKIVILEEIESIYFP